MRRSTCKNCRKPIRRVDTGIGPTWMHFNPENNEVIGYYCKTTKAEPIMRDRPKVTR